MTPPSTADLRALGPTALRRYFRTVRENVAKAYMDQARTGNAEEREQAQVGLDELLVPQSVIDAAIDEQQRRAEWQREEQEEAA